MSKKVKGIRELNNAISAQLRPFGITKTILDKEYSYIFSERMITYTIQESYADECFKEFVEQHFNYVITNGFIFALLHEVGHYVTDAHRDFYNICLSQKEEIDEEMERAETEEEIKAVEFKYFSLPDEILATTWAVSYCKTHPKKIKRMWRECEKALHEFYKINGLTEVE